MPDESTASRIAEIERFDPTLATDVCGNKDVLMKHRQDGLFVRYDDVLALLAKPEPDGWVAVSERLPDEGTLVQLHLLCGDVSAGHLFGENWWVDGGRYSMEEVLAWKSMSAPPVLPEGEKA